MLKKLTNNKKGFTLVEILVAISILAIIVGPLLISLFSNNRVMEQARKETEATYVAKKIMEETMADYYYVRSSAAVESANYMQLLGDLLSNNTSGNFKGSQYYDYTDGETSRYADDFTYEIKIVPTGKDGAGESDSSANYVHIYSDHNSLGIGDACYIVLPDGQLKGPYSVVTSTSQGDFWVDRSGNTCSVEYQDDGVVSGSLNESKNDFRILCYSSNDALATQFNFKTNTAAAWASTDVFLTNYTSKVAGNQVTVTSPADQGLISDSANIAEFLASGREAWTEALYEITVNVYEDGEMLSSVVSVIQVRLFNKTVS